MRIIILFDYVYKDIIFNLFYIINNCTPTVPQFGIYHLLLISFSIFFMSILCIPLYIPLYLKGR